MDLVLRNERGERWRIMQADQSVCLHPGARGDRHAAGMEIGVHDPSGRGAGSRQHHRRSPGKARTLRRMGVPRGLGGGPRALYARPPGRPGTGLVIHLLEGGRYRTAPESRAFTGVDSRGDPHRDERARAVGGDQRRAHPGGRSLGARGGHPSRPHALAAHATPRGAGRNHDPRYADRILASRGMPRTRAFLSMPPSWPARRTTKSSMPCFSAGTSPTSAPGSWPSDAGPRTVLTLARKPAQAKGSELPFGRTVVDTSPTIAFESAAGPWTGARR